MKLEMFAVRDNAVGAYNTPMFFRSRGEALRSFADACKDEKNGFAAHAGDYDFWYVGTFDTDGGAFSPELPERVCGARDFVPEA